jgi:putative hydrolase
MHTQLLGDHHVHSTFSDDAVSSIGQNIEAAAAAGLTTIRCVDHVRASTTWVAEFVAAVAAEPTRGLVVLHGVETKLMDVKGTLDLPPRLGAVPVLIADHQFPGTDGPWSPSETIERGLAPADATDLLITAYVNAMRATENAQLAHPFSILPKIGLSENDLSDEQLRVWAETAAATSTWIEVNEKWACPQPRALRAIRQAGATLVASTDSHKADDVGRYTRVIELLDETERE